MVWKKRGKARNVTEAFKEISSLSMEEVAMPKEVQPEEIVGMEEAAELIWQAVKENLRITVMGDYDADGITATSILYHLFWYLGVEAHLRLPRRYTEGYGLSMQAVDEIPDGLLITVDNGIVAAEQIRRAKEKGLNVIILDHHLPGKVLPEADVIVDPHIAPEQSGFSEYCGAGLAYKLSGLLVQDDHFLRQMCALAAIGTVADIVPLIGDNRMIVKEGLRYINQREVPVGLLALMNAVGLQKIDEQDIGFSIGPMLNAAGRLEDGGAEKSLRVLIERDYEKAEAMAYELIALNEKRKLLLKEGMERAHTILKENQLEEKNPICIYDEKLLSGLAGLIAGRLAEEYRTPAIVLASAGDGKLKGSGRSYGGIHLKYLLDEAAEYLLNYGGHEKAAGVGLEESNRNAFYEKLQLLLAEYQRPKQGDYFYDLEITVNEIPKIMEDLKRYAPFGELNPRPVVRVDQILLLPQAGKLFRCMGDEKEHIRLLGKEFSVVGFHKTAEYMAMGEPDCIDVIGYLSYTNYRRNTQIEIEAVSFRASAAAQKEDTELQREMLSCLMQIGEGGRL